MELQQIDGIRLEPLERLIKLLGGGLPGASIDFGHEENLLAVAVTQSLAHADFALAVVVIPGIVYEVDAVIDSGPDDISWLFS
jgi:hypothetical protein